MEWEYKAMTLKIEGFMGGSVNVSQLETLMNNLGRDGWELTSGFSTNVFYGQSRDVVLLFKRQRENS